MKPLFARDHEAPDDGGGNDMPPADEPPEDGAGEPTPDGEVIDDGTKPPVLELPEEPKRGKSKAGKERLPLILVGFWVRLNEKGRVPKHYIGREGVIISAPTRRSSGADSMSDAQYDYQTDDTPFVVRMRDDSATIEVTRASFAKFAPEQAGLRL